MQRRGAHRPDGSDVSIERFQQHHSKNGSPTRAAHTVVQLEAQLDTFRAYYNTVRPHRALGRRTPHQAYLARPKATPTGTPLHTGAYRIRHDRIDSNGKLTLRHNSRTTPHRNGPPTTPAPTS